ncbi:VCBS repeat-containing protein [Streptomyces sp. NPDC093510]|uniref:FG-GAP repeat domain-containing protein n=1 Tax=Streptomyces sp. NPDC093510 TaxID=3155199 RepID=UPI0034381AB2
MARHALMRHRRARRLGIAVTVSAAIVAGIGPLGVSASAAPTASGAADASDASNVSAASAASAASEAVVPATERSKDLSVSLFAPEQLKGADGAGAKGVFHRLEGYDGLVWTRYADGKTFPVPEAVQALGVQPTGSDSLARRPGGGNVVEMWDAVDRTTRTLRYPESQIFVATYGSTVVTHTKSADDTGPEPDTLHLLTPGADGGTRDVTVSGLPAGSVVGPPLGVDETSFFFLGATGGTNRVFEADPRTGKVTGRSAALPTGHILASLSPEHIAVYSRNSPDVLVFDRSDLSAAPRTVSLENGTLQPRDALAVVGDWLVYRPRTGAAAGSVKAAPIGGGSPVTLVGKMNRPAISAGPAGTAVVVGPADGQQAIQRITADSTGRPVVTVVKPLPRPKAAVRGLALAQGRLLVTDSSSGRRDDYARTVDGAPANGAPGFGERSSFTPDTNVLIGGGCPAADLACSQIHGTDDGRIAWLEHDQGEDRLRVHGPGRTDFFEKSVPAGGTITDVSGRYVLYTAADKQYVYRLDNYASPTLTRDAGPAALWGDVLWTPGTTPGTVTGYDLTAKKTVHEVTTGAGCDPTELQALGRWLYWSCGADGPAGVYDRTENRTVTVPAGEALLGDGYVVTHDKAAGKLELTTVSGGTAATRRIGDLPDTGVSQRHVRWTVDKSGTTAAYVDDQERVHLVSSGEPAQPIERLAPDENAASVRATTPDETPDTLTRLLLSKPAAGWKLTVRARTTGKVVDTVEGGVTRGALTVGWHGADPQVTGEFLPNGAYDWSLSVRPHDGVGAPLETHGTVMLRGGAAVRHDHAGAEAEPDGAGDLLTINSSGTMTFQHGDGKGGFAGKSSAGGWSTKALAVPFGDLDKDRCNDVLVRMPDGALRGYLPQCGQPPAPSSPYKKLGDGWNAYDVLTSPGDLTGDGRADLLARKASTGDIHLFAGKSDGTLTAGKKIRSAWKSYTQILGTGDLNGDGIGDVVARHKDGTLYRYEGRGDGTLKDRAKVFTDWGFSYNTLVGVGDITGDGKADLVARDTSGSLYRVDGKGNGSFSGRKKISTGWGGYKGLF